jgi:hypothetical protein
MIFVCLISQVIEQSQKVSRLLDLLRTIRNENSSEETDENGKKKLGRILIFADTKKTGDLLLNLTEKD